MVDKKAYLLDDRDRADDVRNPKPEIRNTTMVDTSDTSEQSFRKAREAALRYLSFRARTRQEVEEKLREKDFDENAVHRAVERLEELRLIDDAEFAREWIRSRQRKGPVGRRRLALELRNKGVSGDVAEKALDELLEGIDPYTSAVSRLRRYRLRYACLDRTAALRRMMGLLDRWGFDGEIARRASIQIWNEWSEDDIKGDQGDLSEVF